jgi:hypothetical protein
MALRSLPIFTSVLHPTNEDLFVEITACKSLDVKRSSYRYDLRPDRNAALRDDLVKLARRKLRWLSYPMEFKLVLEEGRPWPGSLRQHQPSMQCKRPDLPSGASLALTARMPSWAMSKE